MEIELDTQDGQVSYGCASCGLWGPTVDSYHFHHNAEDLARRLWNGLPRDEDTTKPARFMISDLPSKPPFLKLNESDVCDE